MYKLNKFEISNGQVSALYKRQLKRMLQLVEEYELVKAKQHPEFKKANEFYDKHKLCRQNFLKYYARYMMSGRSPALLLPIKPTFTRESFHLS